jgi:hypothetical protein
MFQNELVALAIRPQIIQQVDVVMLMLQQWSMLQSAVDVMMSCHLTIIFVSMTRFVVILQV